MSLPHFGRSTSWADGPEIAVFVVSPSLGRAITTSAGGCHLIIAPRAGDPDVLIIHSPQDEWKSTVELEVVGLALCIVASRHQVFRKNLLSIHAVAEDPTEAF